jgi:hypothetical protein
MQPAADCHVLRIGGRYAPPNDFGAWSFCGVPNGSIILSVGIGNDVTFDVGMVRRFGAHVHCFDPTISFQAFESLLADRKRGAKPPLSAEERARISFHQFGLAPLNGVIPFWRNPSYTVMATHVRPVGARAEPSLQAPVLKLPLLMQIAAVRHLDILKVDIEGAEVGLFSDESLHSWLCNSPRAPAQIGVEFHSHNETSRSRELDAIRSCGYMERHRTDHDETYLFVRGTSRARSDP